MKRCVILITGLIAILPAYGADNSCPARFDDAIEQTFQALEQRGLDRYMGTLAPDSQIAMILPDGSRWYGR